MPYEAFVKSHCVYCSISWNESSQRCIGHACKNLFQQNQIVDSVLLFCLFTLHRSLTYICGLTWQGLSPCLLNLGTYICCWECRVYLTDVEVCVCVCECACVYVRVCAGVCVLLCRGGERERMTRPIVVVQYFSQACLRINSLNGHTHTHTHTLTLTLTDTRGGEGGGGGR